MARITFLLICAFIPSILTQCTIEKVKPKFARSVYEFSIELLKRLGQEKDNHFVSSTLSTWTLLAYTSLGATDTTLAEMMEVLKLQKVPCFNSKYLDITNMIGVNNETDVILERSSSIFVDDKMPIIENFKTKIQDSGVASIESLSFENTEAAAQKINDFVSRATHEVIDEFITPGDLEDTFIMIIDAIFFKGMWKFPFPFENTETDQFYNEKGAKIGEVNSMLISEVFNWTTITQVEATVLELPYGNGERYSMLVFLPFRDVSLYKVIDNLKLVSLKTIQNLFADIQPDEVKVQFPRFKISSDLNNLKELLEDMGLKTMFDSSRAQFTNLSDYPLYVTNFIQKADIEVTEEGTIAAAATEEQISFRSSPKEINVNKPFLFMIIDKVIEVPLFVGAYSKPSIY